MKFREIKEIRTKEKLSDNSVKKENENFKQIKHETNMTAEEAREFIESLFR